MRTIGVLMLVTALTIAGPSAAEQIFDFDGQVVDATTIGDTATLVSKIVNGHVLIAPLPLDTDNYEYTLVVTGLELVSESGPVSNYANGLVRIYQDDVTAADYVSPSSFDDGVVILEGTLTTFSRNMFSSMLGAGSGTVNWMAGARIDEFHPDDLDAWPFLVSVSRSSTVTLSGFDERWDGKVEPLLPVVPNENQSLGRLKARF